MCGVYCTWQLVKNDLITNFFDFNKYCLFQCFLNSRINNLPYTYFLVDKLMFIRVFQFMNAMKAKKLGLGYQVQDLSAKYQKTQRIALRANKINTAAAKLKKILKAKNRKIRILENNLTAMKAELETLCLHIYKMDSMLMTTTTSMEHVLKVIRKLFILGTYKVYYHLI